MSEAADQEKANVKKADGIMHDFLVGIGVKNPSNPTQADRQAVQEHFRFADSYDKRRQRGRLVRFLFGD